jgi:hypothetical protein
VGASKGHGCDGCAEISWQHQRIGLHVGQHSRRQPAPNASPPRPGGASLCHGWAGEGCSALGDQLGRGALEPAPRAGATPRAGTVHGLVVPTRSGAGRLRGRPGLVRAVWDDASGSGTLLESDGSGTGTGGTAALGMAMPAVLDALIEAAWDASGDSTWPACPRHPQHPLRWIPGPQGGQSWACPTDDQLVATVGQLHRASPPLRASGPGQVR